jgi:hypothetical protein
MTSPDLIIVSLPPTTEESTPLTVIIRFCSFNILLFLESFFSSSIISFIVDCGLSMTIEVFPVTNFTPPNSFSVIKVFNFLQFDFQSNQIEIFPDRLLE